MKRNLYKLKWKVAKCTSIRECWCASIETLKGKTVISEGDLAKEVAEYFVKVHNAYIARKTK